MAIANTASADLGSWTANNPRNVSFDCSGGNILFVAVFTNNTVTDLTATYNGVSMTRLTFGSDASGSNKNALFYLVNPASGSNTVSVTRTGGANMSIVGSAYSGVDTSDPIDDYVFNAGVNSTTFTSSAVTVSDADNWLVASFRRTDNYTFSTTTLSLRIRNAATVFEEIWDSNAVVGSTGSKTVSYTWSPSGRFDGHTLVSLNVASAPASNGFALWWA